MSVVKTNQVMYRNWWFFFILKVSYPLLNLQFKDCLQYFPYHFLRHISRVGFLLSNGIKPACFCGGQCMNTCDTFEICKRYTVSAKYFANLHANCLYMTLQSLSSCLPSFLPAFFASWSHSISISPIHLQGLPGKEKHNQEQNV